MPSAKTPSRIILPCGIKFRQLVNNGCESLAYYMINVSERYITERRLKEGTIVIEIEKPKIETVELSEDGAYGRFVVEPLNADTELRSEIPCAESCSRLCLVRL